eukprot:5136792-Pleurochrysis_carterae.AAC.1
MRCDDAWLRYVCPCAFRLHFGRPAVDHRRWPDGHDGPVWVELARGHHLVVLLDAHVEGHVALLGPSPEGREPEHRVLVAALLQLGARVLHQKGVARVRRVARLEGVDDVGALLLEGRPQLVDGKAVAVEAVVVLNAAEQLDLAAERKVLARREQLRNVRVRVVNHAKRA